MNRGSEASMNTSNLDVTFAALSDPTRRKILNQLSKQHEASVQELAKPFEISLPAISKHLRVLENANLIARKRAGRLHRIRLNAGPLQDASGWIDRYRIFWQQGLDRLDHYLKEQENLWHQKQSYTSEETFQQRRKRSSRPGRKRSNSASGLRRRKSSKP
jgi:DNA-binding transcriptional ArsR family regulator